MAAGAANVPKNKDSLSWLPNQSLKAPLVVHVGKDADLENNADPGHSVGKGSLAPAVLALLACIGWMSVSSSLILVNKYVLSIDNFHYPMALSGLGMAFSSVAAFLVCRVFKWVDARKSLSWPFYLTRILPIGLLMALTLHFGNAVYLHLTVSFIQMLKAFTPIMTMLGLYVAGLETPTRQLITAVILIGIGTAVASYGEIRLSIIGVVFMVLSESFEAMRLVMTQILLVDLRFHPVEGLMYLAPTCALWQATGVLVFEWQDMAANNALALVAAKPALYMAAAALGFGVNTLSYIVILTTSSLTLKVLGTVKNTLIVGLGVALLGDVVTGIQSFGYVVSLAAFAWYNYLKLKPPPVYTQVPDKEAESTAPNKLLEPVPRVL